MIALREYKDASQHTYDMIDDILEGHQQMNAIKLERLPRLVAYFDLIHCQETNPQHHLYIYKLNQVQLKDWSETATEFWKKIMKKSENYAIFSEKPMQVKDES